MPGAPGNNEEGRKMKPTYYEINEETARRAWECMHMADYRPNSATDEYRAIVDDVYGVFSKYDLSAVWANDLEDAEKAADRFARKLAEWMNNHAAIEARMPSWFIAGPANYNTKKHARQQNALSRSFEEMPNTEKVKSYIRQCLSGRRAIQSDDEQAVEKLTEKIKTREQAQEHMKAANAWYRKHKSMEGFEPGNIRKLAEDNLQFQLDTFWFKDDTDRAEFIKKTKPFETYQLSNNNAEIKRLRKRLESLEAAKSRPAEPEREAEICGEACTIVENTDIMRLQIIFDGKPGDECRAALKANGFRWAPSQGAWQRQLTDNARHALRRILAA